MNNWSTKKIVLVSLCIIIFCIPWIIFFTGGFKNGSESAPEKWVVFSETDLFEQIYRESKNTNADIFLVEVESEILIGKSYWTTKEDLRAEGYDGLELKRILSCINSSFENPVVMWIHDGKISEYAVLSRPFFPGKPIVHAYSGDSLQIWKETEGIWKLTLKSN